MTVTSTSSGGSTTYTVNLSTANATKLANTTNAIVISGTNTSVSSFSATVGGVQTFTYGVNAIDTVIESLFTRVKVALNTSTVPTISITSQNNYGTSLAAVNQAGSGSDFITNNNVSSFGEWTSGYTSFTVANFGTPGTTYFPEVSVANIVSTLRGSTLTWMNNLRVEVISMTADAFALRFSDSSGNPVNGTYLQDRYLQLELIFKIQA